MPPNDPPERVPHAHVLLVDDEEAVRTSLERGLRLERFAVNLARDGQQALDLLTTQAYDLIVLDVTMPGVDGLEVCRRLRDIGDRTPVLMLTARDAVDDRVAGLDAGADDYLIKPFALAELKARVRALLAQLIVDLAEQFGAHRDVGDRAGQDDGDRDGGGADERDAAAQAHGSSRRM